MPEPPKILATEITRAHAADLLRMEKDELRRLFKIYREAREILMGRLASANLKTFTAQHLRVTKAQVDSGIWAMVRKMKGEVKGFTSTALKAGVQQTLEEIAFWEKKFSGGATGRIQTDALRRVSTPGNLIMDRAQASLDAYGSNLIGEVGQRLGVHLALRSGWSEMSQDVAGRLKTSVIRGAHWRAERIVRTEMVDALNAGHQAALEASVGLVPGLKRQWDATLDERTSDVCYDLNTQVRALDAPWQWNGKIIMRPPAIPNCRSRIIPYHDEWAEAPAPPSRRDRVQVPRAARKTRQKPEASEKPSRRKASPATRRKRALRREEREIRHKQTEFAVLVDNDGEILFKTTSRARGYVRFSREQCQRMAGKVLTHNHPSGSSFSIQDIALATRWELGEIRVAGTRGFDYRMRPPADRGWSLELWDREILPVLRRYEAEVCEQQWRAITAGRMTQSEAAFQHGHKVWTRVARETGLRYTRQRVKE